MSSTNSAAIVVLMTAGSREEASRLAEMLVGAHLAACVQILPEMESVYRWKGAVHREPEILLLAKTTAACFDELEREVRALEVSGVEAVKRGDASDMEVVRQADRLSLVALAVHDERAAKVGAGGVAGRGDDVVEVPHALGADRGGAR